jgi:glycosyltransferase involved in cell wall biosynthesis
MNKWSPVVVIPVYNNEKTFSILLKEIIEMGFSVIAVDDGCTDGSFHQIPISKSLTIVKHKVNQGKGAAILSGMHSALNQNYTHCITIDADGQHYPKNIPSLLDVSKSNPNSIVIGARNFERNNENIPFSSHFGRSFSNFWVFLETGIWHPDTQSGYRVYPLTCLIPNHLHQKHYDFEIEILVRSNWNGTPILSAPIEVYYPPRSERISHFKPLADNFRLSKIHSKLVCFKILRTIWKTMNQVPSLFRTNT